LPANFFAAERLAPTFPRVDLLALRDFAATVRRLVVLRLADLAFDRVVDLREADFFAMPDSFQRE
jgi:hypothetical protein